MSLLLSLIIGLGVGAGLGYWLHGGPSNLLVDCLAGVVGSIGGLGFFFFSLSDNAARFSFINFISIVCSLIGAALLTLILEASLKLIANRSK